jgi:hypothetical protein
VEHFGDVVGGPPANAMGFSGDPDHDGGYLLNFQGAVVLFGFRDGGAPVVFSGDEEQGG